MAQSENRPPRGNRPPPAQDPNFNWRGVILFTLAIALIGGAFLFKGEMARAKEVPFWKLREMLKNDLVVRDNPERPIELVSEPNSATDTIRGWVRTDRPAPNNYDGFTTDL